MIGVLVQAHESFNFQAYRTLLCVEQNKAITLHLYMDSKEQEDKYLPSQLPFLKELLITYSKSDIRESTII